MSLSIRVEGLAELRAAMAGLEAKIDGAVSDAIAETALAIEADVVTRIQRGPASGRIYKRRGVTHQASAPGEAPMSDTGALAGSVYNDISPMAATVGSRLAYAAYLEHGTRRMAARPVWRPVAEKQGKEFRRRVVENIAEVTR